MGKLRRIALLLLLAGPSACRAPKPIFVSASPFPDHWPRAEVTPPTAEMAAAGADVEALGSLSADRAIAEADILQVYEDRLYVLSRYRGLVIVDLSDPTALHVLGTRPLGGIPFEMYFAEGVVFVLHASVASALYDEALATWHWPNQSAVTALDVRDATHIQALSSFELDGQIVDSRLVGRILYIVTDEQGCWGTCMAPPKTFITSLQLGTPERIELIDQRAYELGAGLRSIGLTPLRIYASGQVSREQRYVLQGHTYTEEIISGTLQVVDISDPSGRLHDGALLQIPGLIGSRWQMDEHEGVLRVITQAGGPWGNVAPPVLQTFAIHDSTEIEALASLVLDVPPMEVLRSARFDGPRAYVVTAEQERIDPLVILDLSNPAAPRQQGSLEMPGWLYHLEPRGDRVLALGFDGTGGTNQLALSLFDVADGDHPALLSRVRFGGDGVFAPEDQNRIHKALEMHPELSLVVMPFLGWTSTDPCTGRLAAGVQLVDWQRDTLALRGMIPHDGAARRALVHGDRLLAISEEKIDRFDIGDRDAPKMNGGLSLSRPVHRSLTMGEHIVELSSASGAPNLDIVPADDPNALLPLASVPLDGRALDAASARLFAHGDFVYVVWDEPPRSACGELPTLAHVAVVDLAEPTSPEVRGRLALLKRSLARGRRYDQYTPANGGDRVVQLGSVLALLDAPPWWQEEEPWIDIIDLSNPDAPLHASRLRASAHSLGLASAGALLFTSHVEQVENRRVRYYLDRFDLSQPDAPVALRKMNIPGALLSFAPETGRLLTLDYLIGDRQPRRRALVVSTVSGDVPRIDAQQVFDDVFVESIVVSKSRLFAVAGTYDHPPRERKLLVLENGDRLSVTAQRPIASRYALWAATDHHAWLRGVGWSPELAVVDATSPDTAVAFGSWQLPGETLSIESVEDGVLVSNGAWGVRRLDLSP